MLNPLILYQRLRSTYVVSLIDRRAWNRLQAQSRSIKVHLTLRYWLKLEVLYKLRSILVGNSKLQLKLEHRSNPP